MSEAEKVQGIVLIPGPSKDALTERQFVSYENHRRNFIEWLRNIGKNPAKREGYALDTAKCYASILDKWHRWAWVRNGKYTLNLTHQDADDYLDELLTGEKDYSGTHLHNVKLALKVYFRFNDDEWETSIVVSNPSHAVQPKNFVSIEERNKLREAALEYGSVPAYHALTPEERDKWKLYLGQRFGKAKKNVSPEDWERANGYKYVSMLYTSLDAGLRPVEVARAKTYWVDLENRVLRIPANESSKNFDNWTVPLRDDTTEFLHLWLEEREMYKKYEDTDTLWLTRHSNPYQGSALRVVLNNLKEEAGIERDFSWYALRHSTGTYMAREEGLAAAQKQLRHRRESTTMKYDQTPDDDLRDALNRMG